MNFVTGTPRLRAPRAEGQDWNERSARLYQELRRPAAGMVRRAFGRAFDEHEIEDIYAGAWVGTLRALETRQAGLDDEEIRKYVFTAVAHQASKELRRRRRKPTAPLENAAVVADQRVTPDEHATQREHSRITRDLLSSLPPRRRAVLLLRYGWGLEPRQVCALVNGLSPRAYRKEITRGIDELVEKLRRFENGEWCADREPVLKAYASGLADEEQQRQARQHLGHCRRCSEFVGRLGRHLHDLGSGLAMPAAVYAFDGDLSLADRLGELAERARDAARVVTGGSDAAAADTAAQAAAAGGASSAGAAGAGFVVKLAGLSAVGKAAIACVGSGALVGACIAAGIGTPRPEANADELTGRAAHDRAERSAPLLPTRPPTPSSVPAPVEQPAPQPVEPGDDPAPEPPPPTESDEPAPPVAPEPPPPTAPPAEQQFGFAPAPAPAGGSGSSGGSTASGGRAQSSAREFGP